MIIDEYFYFAGFTQIEDLVFSFQNIFYKIANNLDAKKHMLCCTQIRGKRGKFLC